VLDLWVPTIQHFFCSGIDLFYYVQTFGNYIQFDTKSLLGKKLDYQNSSSVTLFKVLPMAEKWGGTSAGSELCSRETQLEQIV